MLFKIIIFSMLTILSSYGSIIEFNKQSTKISLLENSFLYIDKTGKLTFNEAKNMTFVKNTKKKLHLGITDTTAWVKFSLKNSSKQSLLRYIVISNPQHDIVELYTKNSDGTYKKSIKGVSNLDFYDRDNILSPSFKVSFQKGEQKDFYLKAHSLTSANFFELFLKDSKQLYQDEFSYQLIESFFFGMIFALMVYNIFIFFFTKEIAYLYYVFLISITTINYFSYSMMSYYLFQDNQLLLDIDAYLGSFYILIANIFALLFIDRILHIKQFINLHRINKVLIGSSIIIIFINIVFGSFFELSMLFLLVCLIYILGVILFSYYKKIEFSYYILLGWSISIVGTFSLAFIQYNIFSPIDIFPYFYELSIFLEAIIFSTVLASKLNKTKELEKSLKMNELLTKELHHRVKNNMQFIILIYRLKFANLTTKEIDEKLHEVEGSVQAMSKIYEILYEENRLEILDTQSYFNTLLEEIRRGFSMEHISIDCDVKVSLDPQKAIYCGIILNELITNSLKYAFNQIEEGKIEIKFFKKENEYIFEVRDNGSGFEYNKNALDSFGLEFINNIVKDKLKGKMTIDSTNKTEVIISFR